MGILPDWMIERDVKITPFLPQEDRKSADGRGAISYGVTSYGYDVRAGYKWKVFDVMHGGIIDPKSFDPKLLREVDLTPPDGHDWFNENIANPTCNRCGVYKSNPHTESWMEKCKALAVPDHIIVPPNSYVLGESMETFYIPRDIAVICVGKSTYARSGIIVNVTPGEPEWEGKWTIEISNSSPLPAKVYCNEGIMQCMFLRTDGYSSGTMAILNTMADSLGTGRPRNADNSVDYDTWSWMQWKAWEHAMNTLTDLQDTGTCKKSYKDKKGKYQNQAGLTLPKVKET